MWSILIIAPLSTTRQYISLALQKIIFKLRVIGNITRCFLSTGNIDKIDRCMAGIEVHLQHLVSHISQKYFNILKSALCVENLVVSQVMRLNKSVIIQKKSLMTVTSSKRHDQVMSKTFHTGS